MKGGEGYVGSIVAWPGGARLGEVKCGKARRG